MMTALDDALEPQELADAVRLAKAAVDAGTATLCARALLATHAENSRLEALVEGLSGMVCEPTCAAPQLDCDLQAAREELRKERECHATTAAYLEGARDRAEKAGAEAERLREKAEKMADHLEWILPMAKAYAGQNDVGSNREIAAAASRFLAAYREGK